MNALHTAIARRGSMIKAHDWAEKVSAEVLTRVFAALDVDGDGEITEDEFRRWFATFRVVR